MLLPSGISGFFEMGDCYENINTKIFKQICYRMANENHGKLLSIDISLNGKNFYMAKIQFPNTQCYLLMNAYYSYISFASSIENNTIDFIDKPENFIGSFQEYIILGLEELNADYQESIEQLNHVEIAQIKYWKPTTIGEIIFNFWD